MLTLRSNVTQQRLKNLQQHRVHLNIIVQSFTVSCFTQYVTKWVQKEQQIKKNVG